MLRPVAALVAARARRRRGATTLSVAAVAAATSLVVMVSGIGLVAADATLTRALAATDAARPLVRASVYQTSARETAASVAANGSLAGLDAFTTSTVRGLLAYQLQDLATPVVDLVVAVDEPAPWVTLTEGRMPAPCVDGMRCEAVLLAEEPADPSFTVGRPAPGMELTIVGRGLLDPAVPFGELDQRGPFGSRPDGGQYQTGRLSPAVLLVDGVDAMAASPALETTGRTYVWAAPLDVAAVHPWSADRLGSVIEATATALTRADPGFTVVSPMPLVEAELARAEAARGRLLIIGSLGVAILLAFAVFLALVVRDDVAAETDRLTAIGARRRDRLTFLTLEAALPTVLGGAIGWAVGAMAVAGLAWLEGADPLAVTARTVAGPGTVVAVMAVLVVAIAAVVVATAPGLPRGGTLRLAGAVAGTAVLILGWQLAAGGALGAEALGPSLASPIVVILPPVVAFLLALAFVGAVPPLLRALARHSSRAPLAMRLSLLSVSREPARPAATLTLLAFSVGAIVFAAGWSASLRQGIDDAATYRSGLDLRVAELGTGLSIAGSVVPTDRYAGLGSDVTAMPVLHEATTSQPGGRVEILGLPPEVLPTLPGWRADFSTTPVADLAERLVVPEPPGGWVVAGHPLPRGRDELVIPFAYAGRPLRLDAIVMTAGGDSTRVPLGDIAPGMTEVRAALPEGTDGGRLTALIFRNPGLVAGSGHQDELRRATITLHGLDGLVDDTPIDLEVATTGTHIVRAPQTTDGLRLPAIVSPDLAATASADGALDLRVGDSASIPLQVVGTASWMPTIVDDAPRFVVVPIDPFLVAMAAAVPGSGRPSEMWIALPDPARQGEVVGALAQEPFRFAEVTARDALVAERADDPLSQAIVRALLVAALAGLLLSVSGLLLGTSTDLRDERGELADLEAQGVTPTVLRRHVLARTGWLALAGVATGLVVGIVLTVVVTAALSLTAEGTRPVPPLAIVIPWVPILAIVTVVLGIVLGAAAWLARRTFRRATLGAGRVDDAALGGRPAWSAPGPRADG